MPEKTRIIQNVIFLDNKTINDIGGEWIPKNSSDESHSHTFREAAALSDTIVFESYPEAQKHLNAIYAHGKKFGGGVAVNTESNGFSADGVNYTLVINNNGKLEIQQFIPITGANADGNNSWEYDSGAKSNITWTGHYAPTNASTPLTQAWEVTTQGGATIQSNSGNEITFTSIPNNATVKCRFSVTQNSVTETEDRQTSWWTRKTAVICSSNPSLSVTGWTSESANFSGFNFTIDGYDYGTETTRGYIPGTSSNDMTDFTISKSFGHLYTGYIYVLSAQKVESFSKYITKNGVKGLAKETFTRVSSTPIKTYSGGKQSLYLYRSNGMQADILSIALTN